MASTDRDDEGKNTNPGHGLNWERKMQQGSPEMPKIMKTECDRLEWSLKLVAAIWRRSLPLIKRARLRSF